MKLDYKKIYDQYNKIPWYLKQELSVTSSLDFLSSTMKDGLVSELNFLAKTKFPKRKNSTWKDLPDEDVEPVVERYNKILIAVWETKDCTSRQTRKSSFFAC